VRNALTQTSGAFQLIATSFSEGINTPKFEERYRLLPGQLLSGARCHALDTNFEGRDVDFEKKAKVQKELGDAGEELANLHKIEELEKLEMFKESNSQYSSHQISRH
jgi:hypothetical protein